MDLQDLLQDDLAIALIALVAGSLLTILIGKIQSKTAILKYICRVERVAISADDQIFGAIAVTWKNSPVRNLYTAVVEVENPTSKDFENISLKVYTPSNTFLLGERSEVVDSPYIALWTETFRAQLTVTEGNSPTNEQWNLYNHTREYTLSVLNRGQVVRITYLCTCPDSDALPGIFVSTQHPGVRLKLEQAVATVLGVPVQAASKRGLFLTVLTVICCALYLRNPWISGSLIALVGLSAQMIGALIYKFERRVVGAISG